MFFVSRKDLPDVLTSYDLVKALAILLVILDHIGYFFFPENDIFRIFGRTSIPIWCFLIGYANSRDLSPPIWFWAGILFLGSIVTGGSIFPLNMLVSIILIRVVLDWTARRVFRNWEWMTYTTFALCLLAVPTMVISDYGTLGLLLALSGYAVRHVGEDQIGLSDGARKGFIGFSILIFALFELVLFSFHGFTAKLMVVCVGLSGVMMYYFRPILLHDLTRSFPPPAVALIKFLGRRTMEIYAIHLLILMTVAAAFSLEDYGWFAWDWLRR
jgi:hypothetical protein